MSERRKGIDEFKIARAFAAVAVAVALYGISLSAVALIGDAPDTGARPGSFWTPRNVPAVIPQRDARDNRRSGTSFWAEKPSSTSPHSAVRLAGDLERAATGF
jgi:hypothetical protein